MSLTLVLVRHVGHSGPCRTAAEATGRFARLQYALVLIFLLLWLLLAGTPTQAATPWQKVAGPLPGEALQIASGPDGQVLLGVPGVGLFHRRGAADPWGAVGGSDALRFVSAVAIDVAGRWYAGTSVRGLHRSSDGVNWEKLAFPFLDLASVRVDAQGTIVASTSVSMHRSTDGGASWSLLRGYTMLPPGPHTTDQPDFLALREWVIAPDGALFLATGGGVE